MFGSCQPTRPDSVIGYAAINFLGEHIPLQQSCFACHLSHPQQKWIYLKTCIQPYLVQCTLQKHEGYNACTTALYTTVITKCSVIIGLKKGNPLTIIQQSTGPQLLNCQTQSHLSWGTVQNLDFGLWTGPTGPWTGPWTQ